MPKYAQRLLRRYRYSAAETAQGIEGRVRSRVEKELSEELDGTETVTDVVDLVHDLMKDAEGCRD